MRKISDSFTKLQIESSSNSVADDDVVEESAHVVRQVKMIDKLEKNKMPVIIVDKLCKKFRNENKTFLKSSSLEEKVRFCSVFFYILMLTPKRMQKCMK